MPIARTWLEPCYSYRLLGPFVQRLLHAGRENEVLRELSTLDADARIPIRTALGLLRTVELETGRDDLGVLAAACMVAGASGISHYVASSAATVGDAVQALVRYAPLLNEAAEFHLRNAQGVAHLRLGSCIPLPRSASDFQVIALWRFIAHFSGELSGYEAWFQHDAPRSLAAHTAALPHVTLRFGAKTDALVFDARLLALPMPTADAELHTVLVRRADEELARLPEVKTLGQRVRAVLVEALHAGYMDCAGVACSLGMSRRSLSRHLEIEQTSYSEILNDVRHEVAVQLLRRTEVNVQEVANRLGYAHAGAFTRAFRRWEGTNPLSYRLRGTSAFEPTCTGAEDSASHAQLGAHASG